MSAPVPAPAPGPSDSATPSASTADAITGRFPVGPGRSLAIDCTGSGAPTVVLEVGFDAAGTTGAWRMQGLRTRLSSRYRVCNYDRANLGSSDSAPTPRTTGDIADDLAALLAAARVPGPYLLVGGSAGGLYVQHYAGRHPEQVVAVLAMNPEIRADLFNTKAFALMTPEEKAGELAYQNAGNSQRIDYTRSAEQIVADGPPRAPLTIIESIDLCPDPDPVCEKVAPVVPDIGRGLVSAAPPGGRYIQVDAPHGIDGAVPDQVVAEIDRLVALPR